MRIAVNTRLLLPGKLDGIGWFSAETLRRIVVQHPEHEFFFLFDRKPDRRFLFAPNVHPIVLVPQARHPLLWYLFFEWSVPWTLRRKKIDLFISPDGWMSLRTAVPTLTVIHDINFEHADDYLRPSHQRYMKRYFPLFAARAARVATVSEFSKTDIASHYGVDVSKIDVVYDGSHSAYRPCSDDEKCAVRQEYTDGKPYFIFVGTVSRRKNLTNTLLAYDRLRSEHPDREMRFVVVGSRYWWGDELASAYEGMRFRDEVVFLGHVDSGILSRLVASAEALVYVSLFEGFGIPILEAFYAETAVITSNVTSMPEVAGDAALTVDPADVGQIASAMYAVASDAGLREVLVAKGRERRELFSWDRTAELLWQSVVKTAEDCNILKV